jgi:hydroxymethylglutaryl-CoA reductase
MAIEESSVVAAASHGAKIARKRGGFTARATAPIMTAQVQLVDVPDFALAQRNLYATAGTLAELARGATGSLEARGGGYRGFHVRSVDTAAGKCLVVHLLVDVRDAMGANAVNGVAEACADHLAQVTGGRPLLRILTNLADERTVRAQAVFDVDELGGPDVAADVVRAWAFADADPYRAATHNKGVMNGVDAVALATGNDWRAVEAGAHAWAARTGRYRSLTRYWIGEDGHLHGEIELPLALGTVGGVTRLHPAAQAALKILGVKSAGELAEVAASVGLAQNLAALRALAAEGIQRGHMRLHAFNLAMQAGVPAARIDEVVAAMLAEGEPSVRKAAEVWARLSGR